MKVMEAKDKELKEKLNQSQICRAMIDVSNESDDWDFEAVAIPADNKQLRYSYKNDEYFYQVLRTGKENIEDSRIESGLPLFDNHTYDKSAANTLGISVGHEFTEEGVAVRVKLGARADEAMRSDIKQQILKTVSIEGDVLDYTIERNENEIPIYYADRWQPTSLSFAPIPQDIGAQIEVKRALDVQLNKSAQPESDNFIDSLIKKF